MGYYLGLGLQCSSGPADSFNISNSRSQDQFPVLALMFISGLYESHVRCLVVQKKINYCMILIIVAF
jgi:hypothetical protein